MPNLNLGFLGAFCMVPAVAATSCNPGYYLENETCLDCGDGYYCTGGTAPRRSCLSLVPDGAPTPNNIASKSDGSWTDTEHASGTDDCICNWFFSDETRTQYLNQIQCSAGPSGMNYTFYHWCRVGYYAISPLGWGDWYTDCVPCTNGPEHSHYTSYSTPSVMYAVESNCPWECDDGYGRVGDTCQPLCATGATHLRAGNTSAPLFATRHTTPAVAVRIGGGICYGNLTSGRATGINIAVGGTTYHIE